MAVERLEQEAFVKVGYLRQTTMTCAEQLERAIASADWGLVKTISHLLSCAPAEAEKAAKDKAAGIKTTEGTDG